MESARACISESLHILYTQSNPPLFYRCGCGVDLRVGSKRTFNDADIHLKTMLGESNFLHSTKTYTIARSAKALNFKMPSPQP